MGLDKLNEAENVPKLKQRVLTAFLELRSEDGIVPITLLRKHAGSEHSCLFPAILQEMEADGLIKIVYGEGYELGVRLTLRTAIPLAFGLWPWENERSHIPTTIPAKVSSDRRRLGC